MAEERTQAIPNDESPPSTSSLESLLSDPSTIAKLSGVLAALGEKAQPPQAQEVQAQEVQAMPAPSTDLLATLLSNPAMLEKLPQILAVLKPLLAATPPQPQTAEESTPAAVVLHNPVVDRDNLLCALKPFLSRERKEAVDSILRISKLGEFLKQMK